MDPHELLQSTLRKVQADRATEVIAREIKRPKSDGLSVPGLLAYTVRKVQENITKAPLEDKALQEALYNYLRRFV